MNQVSLTELDELNKIKIITSPDRVYDASSDILLINPSQERLTQFQQEFLATTNISCNVYLYDHRTYDPNNFAWLLSVFRSSKLTIVDIDNTSPHLQEYIAYFLAQPTTFWLTNIDKPVYNHISKNKIYSFDFLQTLGGNFEKE
jgi:hypothetical protein